MLKGLKPDGQWQTTRVALRAQVTVRQAATLLLKEAVWLVNVAIDALDHANDAVWSGERVDSQRPAPAVQVAVGIVWQRWRSLLGSIGST